MHFVDFDDAALGDPAQDVGNFVADLLFHDFPAEAVERMSRRFIAGYSSYAPTLVREERIYWHALVHLIGKAFRVCLRPRADLQQDLAYVFAQIDRFSLLLAPQPAGAPAPAAATPRFPLGGTQFA